MVDNVIKKVLFLCEANMFRSQIAESFFNKYTKKHKAESAALGFITGKIRMVVIRVMEEKNIELSKNIPKKVTKEMINSANKIILMDKELLKFSKVIPKEKLEVWDIKQIYADEDDEGYPLYLAIKKARDKIDEKVKFLIKRLENE